MDVTPSGRRITGLKWKDIWRECGVLWLPNVRLRRRIEDMIFVSCMLPAKCVRTNHVRDIMGHNEAL